MDIKGVDGYEVYTRKEMGRRIKVRDGKVEEESIFNPHMTALRVIKGKKVLFSYSSGEVKPEADVALAAFLEDEDYDFPEPAELPAVDAFDDRVLEKGYMIEFALAMEEAARSFKEVRSVRHAYYEEKIIEESIENSKGINYSFKRTLCTAYIELSAGSGEEEMGYSYRISLKRDLSPEDIGKEAALKAIELIGGKPLKTGKYTVLLTSEVASELLAILSHSFSGENVEKGKSMLKGKEGERVFSERITIVDSNTKGLVPMPFDGEGSPGMEKMVVKEGFVQGFLYDIKWGRLSGKRTTGNAVRRSISAPPSLSHTNLYIEPGSGTPKVEKGVFVIKELMGVHLANPITGEFSLGATGFMEGHGGVKSVTITGSVFDLFKSVSEVYGDLTFWGTVGSPSLLVEGVNVVGA